MKRVIFACVHNAGRSQMAAAFFNAFAAPSQARAVSAGTEPGAGVHSEVVAVMGEVDIDLAGAKPQQLTPEVAAGAHMLITMGCKEKCPYVPDALLVDWPLADPKGLPLFRVREIRDDIRQRVEHLVEENGWR